MIVKWRLTMFIAAVAGEIKWLQAYQLIYQRLQYHIGFQVHLWCVHNLQLNGGICVKFFRNDFNDVISMLKNKKMLAGHPFKIDDLICFFLPQLYISRLHILFCSRNHRHWNIQWRLLNMQVIFADFEIRT